MFVNRRNVRLLEIEETLMVDIDWINLQVRSVFRKATLDLLFQLHISPSRHVNVKYHQNWLRASMNKIVEMKVHTFPSLRATSVLHLCCNEKFFEKDIQMHYFPENEVYMESVQDLLAPEKASVSDALGRKRLRPMTFGRKGEGHRGIEAERTNC
ncbi:hypothetical protein Tco_0394157 [Tanacetum coccineum]